MNSKKRICWVDNAKGIAIIMVVAGHVGFLPELLHNAIYAFHMPLFFILSGLFIDKSISETTFSNFFIKKVQTLMIPFFAFGFINVLYFYLLSGFSLSNPVFFDIKTTLVDALFCVRHSGKWFLCSLFFAEIILFLVHKYRLNSIFMTLLLFVGGDILINNHAFLPFAIDLSFLLTIFLVIGCLYRKYLIVQESLTRLQVLCLLLMFVTAAGLNEPIDLMNRTIGNTLLFFLSSVCGSLIVCYFSPKKENKILSYLGKNSLIIYAFQSITLSVTAFCYNHFVLTFITCNSGLFVRIVLSIVATIIAISLCSPIIWIINNYMPYLIGKKK